MGLSTLSAVLAALLLATAPSTEGAPQKLRGDRNGDGKLSLPELQAEAWSLMRRADSNQDGRLSAAEWSAGRKRIQRALRLVGKGDVDLNRGGFAKLDTDGDGYVTRGEADAFFAKHFARVDRNGDGGLDRAELRVVMKPAR